MKSASTLDVERFEKALDATMSRAASQDYLDHSKHDALNSPLLWGLFGSSKWTRLVATQAVMRFPVDLRNLLGVPKVDNPKGLALFLQVWTTLAHAGTGIDASAREQARQVCERLLSLKHDGGWGYHYPWQDLGFFAPAGTPNAVVTSFVCQSLMDYFELTRDQRPLQEVGHALALLLRSLPVLKETDDELCLGYMPMPMKMRVMDVSILIGAAIARHARLSGDPSHLDQSRKLVNYVVGQQTEEGAWYYCDPPGDSPLKIDNYHTGFILDALWQYMESVGDRTHQAKYDLGLKFYAEALFLDSGAPRWTSEKSLPHDIHGAAQGIITFSRHRSEYPDLADRIANWTIENLYSGQGFFYYQKRRRYIARQSFMRWCNAWMARALSIYLHSGDRKIG